MTIRLLSQREVCERAGISLATFFRIQRKGQGPQVAAIGSRRLVPEEAFEKWLADRIAPAKAPTSDALPKAT